MFFLITKCYIALVFASEMLSDYKMTHFHLVYYEYISFNSNAIDVFYVAGKCHCVLLPEQRCAFPARAPAVSSSCPPLVAC